MEQAKERGFWIVGLDERGTQDYTEFDWKMDAVLVLGREGAGMHDLAKKTCDHLLRIPMAGAVASLNVSVAGAVVMFEAMRQRSAAGGAGCLHATEGGTTEEGAGQLRRGGVRLAGLGLALLCALPGIRQGGAQTGSEASEVAALTDEQREALTVTGVRPAAAS